jgi:hypothetical protein
MSIKLTMKPTQPQTPAQKKKMMYCTKNGFSSALMTTSVCMHILDNVTFQASMDCGMIDAGSKQ